MKRLFLILSICFCFNIFAQDVARDTLFKLIEEKKIEQVTEFLQSPEGKDKVRWALRYMEVFEFPRQILVKTAMKSIFPHGKDTKKEDVVVDSQLIKMIIYYDDGKDILTDSERMQLMHTIISNEKVRGIDVLFLSILIVEHKKDWWKEIFFRSFGLFMEREKYKQKLKTGDSGFLSYSDEEWCRKSVNLRELYLHFMAVDSEDVLKFNVESSHKELRKELTDLLIKPSRRPDMSPIPVPKSFKIFIDKNYKAFYEGEFDDAYWRSYSDDKTYGGDVETQKNYFQKMIKKYQSRKYNPLYVAKYKLKLILDGKCEIKAYQYKKHANAIIIDIFFGYLQTTMGFISLDGGKHWQYQDSLTY